mmetsp:Transcript_17656/g.34742  ORF Transcript_17656/g.34742 Transcript_17656/m.34742 type:complete len:412 (-) Transcript_17656:411-1646(-)
MDEYILISTRNEGEPTPGDDSASRASLSKLSNATSDCADVFRFEMPELRVGTLEKLMASGDALSKVDLNVEQVIRKIERQHQELNVNNEILTVEGAPPMQYVENFRWNAAKYPTQRPVDELVRQIVQAANKTEAELKESAGFVQERRQRMQALERQKGGNLMVCDLNDVLAPKVSPEMMHDSHYLKTVVVVVSKNLEKEFLESYHTLGDDIVGYGPESDRESVKGSPVVPGSAERIMEDKDRDGYVIYLVTILKKFLEEFKVAAQSARFLVRDFDFDKAYEALERARLEGEGDALTHAQRDFNEASVQLGQWCKTHYGDAFIAWVHVKAIRLFVESVLRYGLPVNFTAALLKPKKKTLEKKVREKLLKLYSHYDLHGMMQMQADEAAAAGGVGEEMFPYVSYKISPYAEKH